jgi:cellulose 1,4-beta-cellobiosidase
MRICFLLGTLGGGVWAQQAAKDEDGPRMVVQNCDADGHCKDEMGSMTIDASYRTQREAGIKGWHACIQAGGMWDQNLCPDPAECAKNCALEGLTLDKYWNLHKTEELDSGMRMGYVSATQYGINTGSRMYMLDEKENYKKYKMFFLKNREFSLDVDVSTLPCGVNAAAYFVEMQKDGGKSMKPGEFKSANTRHHTHLDRRLKDQGFNSAGAKYGTGYCDAFCQHSENFIGGYANMDWAYGSCCTEVDIFEGNGKATAMTAHSCQHPGFFECKDHLECGDDTKGLHYKGVCDKDGCDFNPHRMGLHEFYGKGKTIDTSRPFTAVTQFITTDGTDDGDLKEIRRVYIQDGKEIANPASKEPGVEGAALSDGYCKAIKSKFKDTRGRKQKEGSFDQFGKHGGMKKVGESLDRGMVLVLSLWDDPGDNMRWLDSISPKHNQKAPGAVRGPCDRDQGEAMHERRMHQRAFVTYGNLSYGAIGSTVKNRVKAPPPATAKFELGHQKQLERQLKGKRSALWICSGSMLLVAGLLVAGFARVRQSRRMAVSSAETGEHYSPAATYLETAE